MREAKDVTILIAEDEELLRQIVVQDFKKRGFNVLDAASGRAALEIIKQNRIDVILTDVRMPNGDGVELLDNVKNLNMEVPVVIFVTGFADITLEESYHKGAEAVFSKPFNRKELVETVLRLVQKREEVLGFKRDERLETDHPVVLKFESVGAAIEGRVLNLGRGGMFVSLAGDFPPVQSKIDFAISFSGGELDSIRGEGVVRWVRAVQKENLAKGFGVEFTYLDDENRAKILQFIRQLKTKAFIPIN